tara:strand:+ start:4425 stop:4541 length:117 start_codon:yes stop_codon:yes gene_type:complete
MPFHYYQLKSGVIAFRLLAVYMLNIYEVAIFLAPMLNF